jgi:hypothetical protein
MSNLGIIIASATALTVACEAERSTSVTPPAATSTPANSAVRAPPANEPTSPTLAIGSLASCQPSNEVSAIATRWIDLADADGNRQISRQEGQSFTNFVIGGFFFRADADGNGVVSPVEGRAARTEFLSQYPSLAALLNQARSMTGASPFKAVADMVDVEYGKPLSADDARLAARGALDDLFRVADSNEDGTITPAEARAASWEGARTLGAHMFRSADQNGDGRLDLAEFQRAVDDTTKVAFEAGDLNDNGTLTQQEAATALSGVVRRLGIPAPMKTTPMKTN